MKTFYAFFCVFTKMYLKTKTFILAVILLPIITMGLIDVFNQEEVNNGLLFGVHFEKDSDLSSAVWEKLSHNEDMQFKLYDNDYDIRNDVSMGEICAGYIFDEDFSANIEAVEIKNLVEVVRMEDDIYSKYAVQTIVAVVYEELVPYIANNYLEEQEIYLKMPFIVDEIQKEKSKDTIFKVELSYIDGKEIPVEENTLAFSIIKGFVCIFLMVFSMISTIFISDNDGKQSLFAPHMGEIKLKIMSVMPIYFFGTLTGVVSLILTDLFLENMPIDLSYEIGMLVVYEIAMLIFAILISKVVKQNIIALLIPFVIVFVVITHPIFIDIPTFLPSLKSILIFFPSYLYVGFNDVSGMNFVFIYSLYIILICLSYSKFNIFSLTKGKR